ncbi:MucR family transcriptional regulator [Bosea sp. BK604]|uniref:MucR family transcriptional regulator n=1 Tax=Bosea sp. BK604 TaxID=2512180 RepID=UPI00104A850D|nr:MucR family transcriptional regulator [Bosea sp. BK604]TCR67421.1 MucR family transcriptional regulator [Bosea sp. BK604]
MDENDHPKTSYLSRTADIVSAYVSHNPIPVGELPSLISRVHSSLSQISDPIPAPPVEEKIEAKVSIKKSITPDYLICLLDGKKFKSLKRHLRTAFGMTPDDYRKMFGLPPDYPMVAPNYAEARSNLAKQLGLGQTAKRRKKA